MLNLVVRKVTSRLYCSTQYSHFTWCTTELEYLPENIQKYSVKYDSNCM